MQWLFLLLVPAAYCLPTLIAFALSHERLADVAYLNIALGWTGYGWLAAFKWSLQPGRSPPTS